MPLITMGRIKRAIKLLSEGSSEADAERTALTLNGFGTPEEQIKEVTIAVRQSLDMLAAAQKHKPLPRDPVERRLKELIAIRLRLVDEIKTLQAGLKQVPLGDKKEQARIKGLIIDRQATLRRSKPEVRELTQRIERRARHGLWVSAVTAVCGEEALAKVQEWMRAEQERRRKAEEKS